MPPDSPPTQLSGQEVGRLVLQDLAAVYKSSRAGGQAVGIMTPAEKTRLVSSLTEPEDVVRYNEYRYVHEYLSRAAVMFLLENMTAEACYWNLLGTLEALRLAETENAWFLTGQPRLMTRRQYAEDRKLFDLSDHRDYGRGVAVVEPDDFPPETFPLDKKGRYQPPLPEWRRQFMAESVLAHKKDELARLLADYLAALRETLVIKAAVGLMGKFVGVPEVENLVGEVNLSQTETLNQTMARLPGLIVRRGVFPGERPAEELQAELAALLAPLPTDQLKPTAEALRKARRAVDFSTAQGQSEKIYAILRQRGG